MNCLQDNSIYKYNKTAVIGKVKLQSKHWYFASFSCTHVTWNYRRIVVSPSRVWLLVQFIRRAVRARLTIEKVEYTRTCLTTDGTDSTNRRFAERNKAPR